MKHILSPYLVILLLACGVIVFTASACTTPPNKETSEVESTQTFDKELDKILTNGKPTVLQFTSEYCMDCQEVKPLVSALKESYKDQLDFITVDVRTKDPFEKHVLKKFKVVGVPTLIFVDQSGETKKVTVGLTTSEELEETLKGMLNN